MYCYHTTDWPKGAYMTMRAAGRARRRRAGGQRQRFLGHGDLRLLILSLIAEKPRHGYDLISEIERRSGGVYKPSPGVIYPTLEVIQDLGWVEVKTDGGKKILFITEEGEAILENEADVIEALKTQLDRLSDPSECEDPSDVRTAMRRLRHTVVKSVVTTRPNASDYEMIVKILAKARRKIAALNDKD